MNFKLKKIISMLLVAIMVVGFMPTEVFAAPMSTLDAVTFQGTNGCSVRLDKGSMTLEAGKTDTDTDTVTAECYNFGGHDRTYTWSSSDESVAVISSISSDNKTATIKGVGKGTAVVSLTVTRNTRTATAQLTVTVNAPGPEVRLDKSQATIRSGESLNLNASLKDAAETELSWAIMSGSDFVRIDSKSGTAAVVKGLSEGTAVIRASVETNEGDDYSECTVNVTAPEILSVAITNKSIAASPVFVGDTLNLAASAEPGEYFGASDISWSSSDESVATVDGNGAVTAVGIGNATITAKAADNASISDSVNITVYDTVESITLSCGEALSIVEGGQLNVRATVTFSHGGSADSMDIAWAIADPTVAGVEGTGTSVAVSGSKAGNTTLTASYGGKTAQAAVEVMTNVASIAVTGNNELVVGDTSKLTATLTYLNNNAKTDYKVVWSSSDPDIVTVSQNGLVSTTGVFGTAVVTAEAGGVSAQYPVAVVSASDSLTTDVKSAQLKITTDDQGEKTYEQIDIHAMEGGQPASGVTWSSNNEDVAVVDQNGHVTAVGAGMAVISATVSEKSATTDITVIEINEEKFVTHNITIEYILEDGTEIAQKYIAQLGHGTAFHETIASPVVKGYIADQTSVALNFDKVMGDVTYRVTYVPGQTTFSVVYLYQNIENDDYSEGGRDTLNGVTGESVSKYISGESLTAEGFYVLPFDNTATIASDGSTVVTVKFNRRYYMLNFELNGGKGVDPIYAKYGAPIGTVADPTRDGYIFDGWDKDIPETMPTGDTLTASWKPGEAVYSIEYYKQNNDGSYAYIGTVTKTETVETEVSGDDGAESAFKNTTFKDYKVYHYNEDKSTKEKVKGDGSTIVISKYDLNEYNIVFSLSNTSSNNKTDGTTMTIGGATYSKNGAQYSFSAKVGDNILAKWPTIDNMSVPSKATVKFYGWQYSGASTVFVSKRDILTTDMLSSLDNGSTTTYSIVWTSYTKIAELHYMLQNAEDDNYTDSENYQQEFVHGGTWNQKDIYGFEKERNEQKNRSQGQQPHYL